MSISLVYLLSSTVVYLGIKNVFFSFLLVCSSFLIFCGFVHWVVAPADRNTDFLPQISISPDPVFGA